MKNFTLQIGRRSIHAELLEQLDPETEDEIIVHVDDDRANSEAAITAAANAFTKRHWRLVDDVLDTEPVQRFLLHTGAVTPVEFTVLRDPISIAFVEDITQSLALVRSRMRDKNHWRLQTVQLTAHDVINPKNGERMRAHEKPEEGRFRVLPQTFRDEGPYRGCLPCSWLQGVVVHETVHVCLEQPLQAEWRQRDGLGWVDTRPGTLVRYPGGAESKRLTMRPEDCPTSYAALQEDDDRAESVVAFLFGGALHPLRREAIETILRPDGDLPVTRCEEVTARLPPLPVPRFRYVVRERGFTPLGVIHEGLQAPTIYDVDEYRRLAANSTP